MVYANVVGNPAITVPVAYDVAGLPISLQVPFSLFSRHRTVTVCLQFSS